MEHWKYKTVEKLSQVVWKWQSWDLLGLESWQIGFRIRAARLLIQTLDQSLDPLSCRSVDGFNKRVPTAILWSQFYEAAAIQNTLTNCPQKDAWVGRSSVPISEMFLAPISLLSVLVHVILHLPALFVPRLIWNLICGSFSIWEWTQVFIGESLQLHILCGHTQTLTVRGL